MLVLKGLFVAATLSGLVGGAAHRQASEASAARLALVGGTIYFDAGKEPLRDGVLIVEDGKVAALGHGRQVPIPRGAQTLDCQGMTITAGFWNSHVHFFERKWAEAATLPAPELGRQLQEMLTRYGFTSVFDLGSNWDNTRRIRARIQSGEVPGPRIRATGAALLAPHALPSESVLRVLGFMTPQAHEIADAAQAAAAARRVLDEGVDGIKLHLQPPPSPHPPFPAAAIPAIVSEAHRSGKPAFVHPNSGADVLAAALAGADVIAHTTPRSGPWDDTTLATMKEQRVALTPTLTLWKYFMRHDRVSVQEQLTGDAVAQLRAWVAAGGTVLFGTDVGALDYDPSPEYALMAEAGMSLVQILASLTTAPAERFEGSRAGRIAPGLVADLAVLNGDPSKDIRVLASVRYTLRAGTIIYDAARTARIATRLHGTEGRMRPGTRGLTADRSVLYKQLSRSSRARRDDARGP